MSGSGTGDLPHGAALFARLEAWQDRPLLAYGDRQMTATQIHAQAGSIAAHLRAQGLRAGDVGLICLRDPIATTLTFLAQWYLGASPLVLDFRVRAQERLRQFQTSGARFSIVDPGAATDRQDQTLAWSPDWLQGPPPPEGPEVGPAARAAPALLLASSGTTGAPKIYAVDYPVMLRWGDVREVDLPLPQGWALCALPMQYVASVMLVLRNLMVGLPVRFHPVVSAASELTEALLRHPIVHTALPPSVIRAMSVDAGPRDQPLLEHVRSLRSSGGPALPDDKIAAYRHLSSGYNMAFGAGLCGFVSVLAGDDVLRRPETSGRVHRGMRVEILGPDGMALPAGQPGAMRVHTPTPSRIVAAEQATTEVLGDGWCMTGDIATLDAEGFLTIVGRSTDMILRGGVSISATEVEAALARLDGVRDVAVLAVASDVLGQEVAAAVVAPGLDIATLKQHSIANIAPDRRPRHFALVDALPYSANGKLMRRLIDPAIFDQADV